MQTMIFKDYGVAAMVEPDTSVLPLHRTVSGKACICVPLELKVCQLDKLDQLKGDFIPLPAKLQTNDFLAMCNGVFNTTFKKEQFK